MRSLCNSIVIGEPILRSTLLTFSPIGWTIESGERISEHTNDLIAKQTFSKSNVYLIGII